MTNFIGDAKLAYGTKTYNYSAGADYRLSENYRRQFLPLVNPGHPGLTPSVIKSANSRHFVSLVKFIEPTSFLNSFNRIKSAIGRALPEDAYQFSSPELTHLTIAGLGDQMGFNLGVLPEQVSAALMRVPPVRVQIRGAWLNNFILGRGFLRVYPEAGDISGANRISELIRRVGGKDWNVYPIGFVQLTRDLTSSETSRLVKIFKCFEEEVFAETLQIDRLSLVSHSNDLLINHNIL